MNRQDLVLSSIGILGFGFTMFSQAQSQTPQQPPEEPPALTVPKNYRYNSQGRRDPFVNPVPKPKPTAVAQPSARPPGLKGVLLSEAQISGVVTSREPSMNVVVILAPGAKAAYFARVGDQLYDAVVKSIKFDAITFTLTAAAGADAQTPRDIVRRVRPNPGENK